MSLYSQLEELDELLLEKDTDFKNIIDRRKQILAEIGTDYYPRLDFLDREFLAGELTNTAYIRERQKRILGFADPRAADIMDTFKYQSLEQDLGLLDNVISGDEYLKRKKELLQKYSLIIPHEHLQEIDRNLLDEKLEPKEYIKQRRKLLEKVYGLIETHIPDPEITVLSQKLLFLVTLIFGIFFIVYPQLNYYSKICTIGYFGVLFFGLYGYYFKNLPKRDYQPYISVIIPVYNGEKEIYSVIKSHCETNYPHDKMEILIANDGSKDRTVSEVQRAIMDNPEIYIRHLRYEKNGGKRQVIRKAFEESTGEVIIRCDGDTYVEKDSHAKLVQHLQDSEIGGVTGFTRVKNNKKNILTRLQSVRYNYGFQQLYSFHNLLGSVYCLPGCFSAYRRTAIEPFIFKWSETRPTLSEDRHMAHLLLENGYKTIFVKDAISHTNVPDTLKAYTNQQFRWGKANALQQLRAITFMPQMRFAIFFFYLVTYFITLTTPFAILRLLVTDINWVRWLIIVTLSALARGLITEGFHTSALYVVPLFFLHLIFDVIRLPWALGTLSTKD